MLSEVPMDDFAMVTQQSLEMNELENDVDALKSINPTILKTAGLDAHAKVILHHEKTKKHSLKRVISETIETVKRVKKDDDTEKQREMQREPVCTLRDLVPSEVKRLTGFEDIVQMLSFGIIVCEGNVHGMARNKASKMTWLEE